MTQFKWVSYTPQVTKVADGQLRFKDGDPAAVEVLCKSSFLVAEQLCQILNEAAAKDLGVAQRISNMHDPKFLYTTGVPVKSGAPVSVWTTIYPG